jgi:hypothetical protein
MIKKLQNPVICETAQSTLLDNTWARILDVCAIGHAAHTVSLFPESLGKFCISVRG